MTCDNGHGHSDSPFGGHPQGHEEAQDSPSYVPDELVIPETSIQDKLLLILSLASLIGLAVVFVMWMSSPYPVEVLPGHAEHGAEG